MRHLRPSCSHCVYWVKDLTANPPTSGHCHRYPPGIYINPQSGTVVQKFPATEHQQWCGEWSDDDKRLIQGVRTQVMESARHL